MKNRRFVFLTAMFAVALLVGNTSNTFAQDKAELPDCPSDATAVVASPPPQPTPPPEPVVLQPPPAPPVEDPCKDCKKENSDLRQQLDGAHKLIAEQGGGHGNSPAAEHSADWHWGIGGKFAILPGQKAGLTQIYGMSRWLPGPVGVEALLGLGVWPTSNGEVGSAPFAGSLQLAALLPMAEKVDAFLGVEYSGMRTPFKEKSGSGWASDLAVLGGASAVFGHFQARLSTGPSVYASMERLHGWWVGLELGYYY